MNESKKIIYSVLGLLIGSLMWGASFYQIKEAMNYVQPLPFVAIRMGGAALILAAVALFLKKDLLSNLRTGVTLGIVLSVIMISQTVGLKYTSASNSGFITGMFVVFVPVFSFILFKRKSSFIKIIALLVNVFGLWILTGGLNRLNIGDVLTIVTAIFSGVHIVYISEKTKDNKIDLLVLCFQQLFIAGLTALIISLFAGYPILSGVKGNIANIGYIILFPTVASFLLQLHTQKHLSTVRSALILTTEPIFAAVFAWTFGGEKLIPVAALGGFIMVAGMIISEVEINKYIAKSLK